MPVFTDEFRDQSVPDMVWGSSIAYYVENSTMASVPGWKTELLVRLIF